MVSVGYMDPGNWATAYRPAGSKFGYTLLSVIMIEPMAFLLQALSARLGIVTGRDLAQACRDADPRSVGIVLWLACEFAIIAATRRSRRYRDRLEAAVRYPVDRRRADYGARRLPASAPDEQGFPLSRASIIALLIVIAGCFLVRSNRARGSPRRGDPRWLLTIPADTITDPEMLYIAIGIIGAR